MSTRKLLDAATQTGVGAALKSPPGQGLANATERTYQATVTGTGAVSATILIEFSNDEIGWLPDAANPNSITLSGTNLATDGFVVSAPWGAVRANLTAISGTGAAVTVTEGS